MVILAIVAICPIHTSTLIPCLYIVSYAYTPMYVVHTYIHSYVPTYSPKYASSLFCLSKICSSLMQEISVLRVLLKNVDLHSPPGAVTKQNPGTAKSLCLCIWCVHRLCS